jgi:uncharacterized protein (UPF0332 family)
MGASGDLLESSAVEKYRQRRDTVVSGELTPEVLMSKALRACASARALLDLNDVDGACNRAYYAMFDAARAALLASGALAQPHLMKTHSGLMAAFGLHLIKNGPLSRELGRLLKRAEEIRLVADYTGDSVELDDARELVGQAERFVDTMRTTFIPIEPKI